MLAEPSAGLSGDVPGIKYAGKNYGEGGARNLVKYAVGVIDDSSSTVELFPVDTLFCMRPDLRVAAEAGTTDALASASAQYIQASTAGAETVVDQRAATATRKLLVNEFGSKLKQKQYRSRDANVIDAAAVAGGEVVKGALADSAAAATAASDEGADQEVTEKWMLPPYDKAAKAPADVYPVHSLIPLDLGQALAAQVGALVKVMKTPDATDAWLKANRVPGLVTFFINKAKADTGMDRKSLKHVARVSLFLSHLLVLNEAPTRMSASAKLLELSKEAAAPPADEGEDASEDADVELSESGATAATSTAEAVGAAAYQEDGHAGGAEGAAAGAGEAGDALEEDKPKKPTFMPAPGLTENNATAISSLKFMEEGAAAALLANFAEKHPPSGPGRGPTFQRTKQLRDKLLLYICACMLHLEGFSMPLTTLSRRLRIVQKSLLKYFQQLGCSYKSSRKEKRKRGEDPQSSNPEMFTEYSVKLDVPLTFPSVRKGRK